jgi:hypothetical protein
MQDKVEYEKRKNILFFRYFYFFLFLLLGIREQAARFRATDI